MRCVFIRSNRPHPLHRGSCGLSSHMLRDLGLDPVPGRPRRPLDPLW